MCYNVDDILPICEELELPLVVSSTALEQSKRLCTCYQVDYHHDWIHVRSLSVLLIMVDPLHVSHRPNL